MILSGSAVQTKGLGSSLASSMKRLIAAWSSMIERKTPRWRRRLVSLAKKPSTALSQEQEVGVKWKTKRGWRLQPRLDLRVFVRGVVVEDDVHDLAARHGGLDAVQKPDELLMAVALHAAADDLALEYVERRASSCRVFCNRVSMVAHRPFFRGSPGWVRSRAWICDFSSTERTTACA